MKTNRLSLLLGLGLAASSANAAGPLYLTEDSGQLRPLVWDTSNGPIPVYVDGGEAFTYDFDGVTPFLTIERANEITAFAFEQWSSVPTSNFRAEIAGTIADQAGIADVTGANATELYSVENGYGFWVLYDTDGSIMEDYFGVPRDAVLGIAFPEWADGQGRIIEATAVMNGWAVHEADTEGKRIAGVFSHEFGHAINLSHAQVNGPMVYQSYTYAPYQPGIKGCVTPVHRYDYPDGLGATPADASTLETMFPFIDTWGDAAMEQSTIDHPDDIAAISNLYPTADYASSRGSIRGVLQLKDGKTQYSGINVVARNVNDLMGDAVSAMTGDQTQGYLGPDGRFTINNLTPGQQYVVHIEEITSGGYPTAPQMMLSQGEYWNAAEGSDPAVDLACDATAILAEAGVTKAADITYNGYTKGVQFTPLVAAHLVSLSKNGRKASGTLNAEIGFFWDQNKGFELLPEGVNVSHGAMNHNGQLTLVSADPDGNGIEEAAILGSSGLALLGDLNGDTCGGGTMTGMASASGWDLDDSGSKAVGFAYVDRDGDGDCQSPYQNEIVPFVWDARRGMRELHVGFDELPPWTRAAGISGNGRVIVGTANLQAGVAWVDERQMIDLGKLIGARDLYVSNYDGTRVPMFSSTRREVVLWNAMRGTGQDAFTSIDGLRYCRDVPYSTWFEGDLCEQYGEEFLYEQLGTAPMNISAVSDKGDVILGRAGSFFTGFSGGIWIEGLGWMSMSDFLHKQGVVEAQDVPFDNPLAVSASGSEIVGGIAGANFSWMIQADQVYVCEQGQSVLVGFPNGLREKVAQGAQFGRCEFLN